MVFECVGIALIGPKIDFFYLDFLFTLLKLMYEENTFTYFSYRRGSLNFQICSPVKSHRSMISGKKNNRVNTHVRIYILLLTKKAFLVG